MDEWMDVRMDTWMDGCADVWRDGGRDGWMVQLNGRTTACLPV